ncbi:hypothetical protein D082_22690 [Synechocystis sp. PCC 6714]|nr:hypothetical protein D082_22690 [Synechocystis sp. PCC 6714]
MSIKSSLFFGDPPWNKITSKNMITNAINTKITVIPIPYFFDLLGYLKKILPLSAS